MLYLEEIIYDRGQVILSQYHWRLQTISLMTIEKICQILLELIQTSDGELITLSSGEEVSFKQLKKYSLNEIEIYQSENEVILPANYKKLLTIVGSCQCYLDDGGNGLTFICLEDSKPLLEKYYSDYLENCPQFFIALDNNLLGDVGGFNLKDGKFTIIPHDEDPEEWFATDSNWVDFKQWLDVLVSSSENQYII
ncbi:MAG: hypothetical protein QNJ38_06510 [Prochloraceae cyanobacterium]|nr:hypothetical protein [Prochloraceae cyanobacterium]